MNKTIGLQLVGYSLLLASLSWLAFYLAPALARTTVITGLAGGLLCLIWGIWIIKGGQNKILPVLTLIAVCYVMLSQTVITWGDVGKSISERGGAASIITLLLLLTIAMLIRIAYAGMELDGIPKEPRKNGSAKIPSAKK